MIDFTNLIKNKEICEIHMDNDEGCFKVGLIFHANEDSVYIKSFGVKSDFSRYEAIPIDYITKIQYGTMYIETLGELDKGIDDDLEKVEWKNQQEFLNYLKTKEKFVVMENYHEDDIANGIVMDYDDGSVTLKSYNNGYRLRDGYSIVNTDEFYVMKWGGKIALNI